MIGADLETLRQKFSYGGGSSSLETIGLLAEKLRQTKIHRNPKTVIKPHLPKPALEPFTSFEDRLREGSTATNG